MYPVVCAIRDASQADADAAAASALASDAAARLLESSDSDDSDDEPHPCDFCAAKLVGECNHWVSSAFQFAAIDHLDKRYSKEIILPAADFEDAPLARVLPWSMSSITRA